MQVGKYFYCLLGNAEPNDDIIVTSQQRFFCSSVASSFVSLCAVGGGQFEHHFCNALLICRLVDYFYAKMCELTLQMILLCNCSLSLNVCNIGLQCNLQSLSTTVLQGSVAT